MFGRTPPEWALFMTLFWIHCYPDMSIMSILFGIHPRTVTRVVKRTIRAQIGTTFQNPQFEDVAFVVDGTEIRISRPSDPKIQRSTFFSSARIGAHDQAHWNELRLRETFLGKAYGIVGDGGFTFNRQADETTIKGYAPHKKPVSDAGCRRELDPSNKTVENPSRNLSALA